MEGKSVKTKKETSSPKYLFCGEHETKERILERVNSCANNSKGLIVLEMIRVNLDIIDAVYKIIGKRLRVMPYYGQERKRVGTWDYPYYTYKQILEGENTINMYVKGMLDHLDKDGDVKSLSPLEKFIATYIITTKFAEYQDEDNYEHSFKHYHVSRSVYEIMLNVLDRRIVCVGYVNFPRELLYRVGLKDTASIDFTFTDEPKNALGCFDGHDRLLIHLKDPKYNIDGVYMSDPTEDSDKLKYTRIDHMLMSYEEVVADDDRFEVDLNQGIVGANNNYAWKIYNEYDHYDFPEELFHKAIPHDTIVKAYLAVEHFLDKEMKMVNNNEYGILEYYDIVWKLKMDDLIDRAPKEIIYEEAIKLSSKELFSKYSYIAHMIIMMFNKKLNNKYTDFYLMIEKKEPDVIVFVPPVIMNKSNYSYKKEVIYELEDKPIVEQLDSIYEACERRVNEYSKMSRKK